MSHMMLHGLGDCDPATCPLCPPTPPESTFPGSRSAARPYAVMHVAVAGKSGQSSTQLNSPDGRRTHPLAARRGSDPTDLPATQPGGV
jgi:hypothetical protein